MKATFSEQCKGNACGQMLCRGATLVCKDLVGVSSNSILTSTGIAWVTSLKGKEWQMTERVRDTALYFQKGGQPNVVLWRRKGREGQWGKEVVEALKVKKERDLQPNRGWERNKGWWIEFGCRANTEKWNRGGNKSLPLCSRSPLLLFILFLSLADLPLDLGRLTAITIQWKTDRSELKHGCWLVPQTRALLFF